ncbi:hypothetical protein V8G54_009128 [Vigna mungo]|uniref:Uncharacterized protein n=1 Tax=Vigna mungo TaxID=3915 RepID=A0AAQ3NW58_VIGMU
MEKLKILNLSHSHYLTKTPDFLNLPNLEKLVLMDCPRLSEVSYTIGHLTKIDKFEEDIEQMESLTTLVADKTAIRRVPFSIVRSKSIGYISLCGYEGFSRNVFPSIIWSWMSPVNSLSSRVQTLVDMSSLVSLDVQNSSSNQLSYISEELPKLQSLWIECGSDLELSRDTTSILDALNATNSEESESYGTTSQMHNNMNRSDGGDCLLPSDCYPDWLTFSSEGSSVTFEIPQVNGRSLKTMMCHIHYSSPDSITSDGLKNLLVINHTKSTIQLYKRNALSSFDDEEWQRVLSNSDPGNKVQIVVVFWNRITVKKTSIYLIYEAIDEKEEHYHASNMNVPRSISSGVESMEDLREYSEETLLSLTFLPSTTLNSLSAIEVLSLSTVVPSSPGSHRSLCLEQLVSLYLWFRWHHFSKDFVFFACALPVLFDRSFVGVISSKVLTHFSLLPWFHGGLVGGISPKEFLTTSQASNAEGIWVHNDDVGNLEQEVGNEEVVVGNEEHEVRQPSQNPKQTSSATLSEVIKQIQDLRTFMGNKFDIMENRV